MELEEGEIICDKCRGSGNEATFENKPDYRVYSLCDKCKGKGKLDWIEVIVGKKQYNSYIITNIIPKIRHKYPKLIASDLLTIQPLVGVFDEEE